MVPGNMETVNLTTKGTKYVHSTFSRDLVAHGPKELVAQGTRYLIAHVASELTKDLVI